MADMRDRIRGDENWFQRLAESIPGFDGYREREIRRAGDRLVRDHLVKMLDEQRRRLEQLMGESGTSNIELTSKIGRTQRHLTTVHDRIDHADYGYTGFFDAVKINEEGLDRLYEYDVKLIEDVKQLAKSIDRLEKTEMNNEKFRELVEDINEQISALESKIRDREEIAQDIVPEDDTE
ncbi:MAG: hypothetical protein ACLFWB_11480 [Armatimonadota bacterium]